MIDDGVSSASGTRTAEGQSGPGAPVAEREPRPDKRAEPAVPAIPAVPGSELPRDIAREAPRDIAREATRPPLRDIARDTPPAAGKDATARETVRERLREPTKEQAPKDPSRDPIQEFLRDVATSREAERRLPPAPMAPRAEAAPPAIAARPPGMRWLTILILVLGLIGGALMAWQLSLLQGQMTNLRAAVTQYGKVADAASRLADAAMQSNEIANQALASSTRPWVGVDAVEAGPIQSGQPLTIEVRVRNSGRTPSTDVQGLFLVYISPIDNPPALLKDQCASCVRSVVLPNGVVSYKLSVRDSVMSADEVQRIKEGKDTMWIVGRLDYHDGEGEAHTTRSCLYYRSSGMAAFSACSDGNSAN